ncbi:MAG: BatD family protein [bacterium]
MTTHRQSIESAWDNLLDAVADAAQEARADKPAPTPVLKEIAARLDTLHAALRGLSHAWTGIRDLLPAGPADSPDKNDMPGSFPQSRQLPADFVITRRSLIVAGSIVIAASMTMSAIVAITVGIWNSKHGSSKENSTKQAAVQTVNKQADTNETDFTNSTALTVSPTLPTQVFTSTPLTSEANASTNPVPQNTNSAAIIPLYLSTSRTSIQLGESFTLTLEVSDTDRDITEPDLSSFPPSDILFLGQRSSSRSSITVIYGSMTRKSIEVRVFSYKITPHFQGAYHTGPVRVVVAGKTYFNTGVTVEVAGSPGS